MVLKPQSSPVNARLWARVRVIGPTSRRARSGPCTRWYWSDTGVGPGTRYLDVGCGAGGAAQLAAGRGAEVSGIDAADTLLAIARERTPNGSFHIGDLETLPFDDAAFDVVTGF